MRKRATQKPMAWIAGAIMFFLSSALFLTDAIINPINDLHQNVYGMGLTLSIIFFMLGLVFIGIAVRTHMNNRNQFK